MGRRRTRQLLIFGNLAIAATLALAIERSDVIIDWVRFALVRHPLAAITMVVLLIALSAHAARRWNQYWYGSFEVVCGCFFCYVTSDLSSESVRSYNFPGVIVAYAGGAFTIVRGLGNIRDGLRILAEYPRLQKSLLRLLDPASLKRRRQTEGG